MKKVGGIFLGVMVVLIVLILGAGIYFYNFYVFKTVRVCVGETNDIKLLCESKTDCVDKIMGEVDLDIGDAPDFVKNNFDKVVDKAVYCDKTCFVKDVRGLNFESGEFEMLDSCNFEEEEIVIEIRGKDCLKVWKYLEGVQGV